MPADPADAGDAEDVDGEGAPQGLSWSYELDFGALIAALAGVDPPGAADTDAANAANAADGDGGSGAGTPAPGSVEEEAAQEAILDELAELDARAAAEGRVDGGRVPLSAVAGRVAERLAPGPDLAAWLATASPAGLDDGDLAAVAGSWRRVASWAQARELAAVAQMTSRAAARDEHAGINCDGRPSQVTASAAAEVALELTMSQYGASAWADLAVQLSWRLAATGAALDKGVIDVSRARLIAEATGMLSDETARAVEERVLPAAGGQTTGMLRAALRRAVIAADPRGAEERRKDAERRAQVVLYPDQDCTATLAGQRLPAIHAAAAMARITAMAWAMKASGAGGVSICCVLRSSSGCCSAPCRSSRLPKAHPPTTRPLATRRLAGRPVVTARLAMLVAARAMTLVAVPMTIPGWTSLAMADGMARCRRTAWPVTCHRQVTRTRPALRMTIPALAARHAARGLATAMVIMMMVAGLSPKTS